MGFTEFGFGCADFVEGECAFDGGAGADVVNGDDLCAGEGCACCGAIVSEDECVADHGIDHFEFHLSFGSCFHSVHDGGDVAIGVVDGEFHVGVDGFVVFVFFEGEDARFGFGVGAGGCFAAVGVLRHGAEAYFFKTDLLVSESGEYCDVVAQYVCGLL